MSDRRFTDKPLLNPYAVRGLGVDHAAMVENRTLFPSTVVTVTDSEPDRLLVSGRNNRKLGETVEKGRFKGYALYGLSLEERATCPADCAVRDVCYGNGMQMARRHRIGDADTFYDRLALELCELLDEHKSVLVRLHVLGDFPSVEYVSFWADALDEHPGLAVYGYTSRRTQTWGGDEIGDAIEAVKERHGERFRIRWSGPVARADGALVIGHVPKQPRIEEGLVCPSQIDATACCATCGLCWEPAAARECIVFVKHGPKSNEAAAQSAMAELREAPTESSEMTSEKRPVASVVQHDAAELRGVAPLNLLPAPKPLKELAPMPEPRLVSPQELRVEEAYQRNLSARSISLIRKIVNGWDWAKFKPPICAEVGGGLRVIDGQHTAIAAATRGIHKIPVLVVSAKDIEKRAQAFVAHNRDRLTMSPLQIFHAEAVGGDVVSQQLLTLAQAVGATIPRSAPPKGTAKPGQIVPVRELKRALASHGEAVVRRVLWIAVASEQTPLNQTVAAGLITLLTAPIYADVSRMKDSRIANAVKSLGALDVISRTKAIETEQSHWRTCAALIAEAARTQEVIAA